MRGDLTGVMRKIGRAHRHLADLKQGIDARLEGHRFSGKYEPQGKRYVVTVDRVPVVDPDWSVQLGDLLHNLRSALDHLAWQLVLVDGGTPGKQTKFPIRDRPPKDKKDQTVPVQLAPPVSNPKIVKRLEECQPYYRGQGEPIAGAFDARRTPLWRVQELNNIDKHRLLLVTICVIDAGEVYWGLKAGDPEPVHTFSLDAVKEGCPAASFDFDGAEGPPDFDPHLSLTVVLEDPAMPALRMVSLVEFLDNLVWTVESGVLGMHFREFFP